MSQNPSSSMKFNLPVLKLNNKTSESAPNSLSEFAKLQLKNLPSKNEESERKFSIPNIFAPTSSSSSLSTKTNEIQVIDLKSALLSDNEKKILPKEEVGNKKNEEVFIPQFVDCDMISTPNLMRINQDDGVEIASITLNELLKQKSSINEPSMVGKIIGKRFHKKIPNIHHSYYTLRDIPRFQFNVPSPDDQILAHLNKKKK